MRKQRGKNEKMTTEERRNRNNWLRNEERVPLKNSMTEKWRLKEDKRKYWTKDERKWRKSS
jgi:hypothetical protein